MTALDVYRNMLKELDKFESPSFTISDFNYFINSAVSEFVDDKLSVGPDIIQSDHDDLAVLLSDPTSLVFGTGNNPPLPVNEAPLPNDYRNMLGMRIVLKVNTAFENYSVNDEIVVYPKKRPTNREGFVEKNAYQSPYDEEAWYELRGTSIEIIPDSNTEVKNGTIRYLKQPSTIYLNPAYETIQNPTAADNSIIEFKDHTMAKITKKCREIFLENIESARLQTTVQDRNFRPN